MNEKTSGQANGGGNCHSTLSPVGVGLLLLAGLTLTFVPSWAHGLPMPRSLGALGLVAILWVLPGMAVSRACLGGTVPAWARLATGAVAGPILAGPVEFLAGWGGVRWVGDLILAFAGLWGLWLVIRDWRADPPRPPRGPALACFAIWCAVVAIYIWPIAKDLQSLPDGSIHVGYVDSSYHAALAALSLHEVPPPTPSFPAVAMKYHFFPHILAGRLSTLSGLSVSDVQSRIQHPLWDVGVALGVFLLAWAMGLRSRWAPAWILLTYYMLGSPLDALAWGQMSLQSLLGRAVDYSFGYGVYSGDLDRVHMIAGSANSTVHFVLGTLLALLFLAGRQARPGKGPLLLAGLLIVCLEGYSEPFATTFSLVFFFWLIVWAVRARDFRLFAIGAATVAFAFLLRRVTSFSVAAIALRITDPKALAEQAGFLAVWLGMGLGIRVLFLAHVPASLAELKSANLGLLAALSGIFGWIFGALVLAVEARNEFHFLVYSGATASLLTGAFLSVAVSRVWEGDSVIPNRRGVVLAAMVGVVVLTAALLAFRGVPRLSLCYVGWLGILSGLWALSGFHPWLRFRHLLRRGFVVCVLASCLFSGLLVSRPFLAGHYSFLMPAELSDCALWIRDHTEPGERFLSVVREFPGGERSVEKPYMVQAIAERASIADADKYGGVVHYAEFREIREVLDQLLSPGAEQGRLSRLKELVSVPGQRPVRWLLVSKSQLTALWRNVPGVEVVLEEGSYCVVDLWPSR